VDDRQHRRRYRGAAGRALAGPRRLRPLDQHHHPPTRRRKSPTDDTFPPGASLVDPTPLSTDPGILAHRLDSIDKLALGPQSALRALAEVNQWQVPGREVRAAAVAVLRDTDGLAYHGTVTDRAGRPGIAVAATSDNGGTRDLVILDPHTGELLAYEHTAIRDPGKLGITEPTVVTYTLYVIHTRTPSVQQR
jgi:hypothetical protein